MARGRERSDTESMMQKKTRLLTLGFAAAGLLLASCSESSTAPNTPSVEEKAFGDFIDLNPLTSGEITASESSCITGYVAERDTEILNYVAENRGNASMSALADNQSLAANQELLREFWVGLGAERTGMLIDAVSKCTRDHLVEFLLSNGGAEGNPLSKTEAECYYDELYKKDDAVMKSLLVLSVRLMEDGIDLNSEEADEISLALMLGLSGELNRAVEACETELQR